jgi:hypothetical protein
MVRALENRLLRSSPIEFLVFWTPDQDLFGRLGGQSRGQINGSVWGGLHLGKEVQQAGL